MLLVQLCNNFLNKISDNFGGLPRHLSLSWQWDVTGRTDFAFSAEKTKQNSYFILASHYQIN